MTTQQLALVFGPILMGTAGHYHQNRSDMLKEMQEQCRVVEIIIDGFSTIFEA